MSDLVKIKVDGQEVEVPPGTLLVEAARKIGIEIPVYCYHPKMKPVGACRVCVVDVVLPPRPGGPPSAPRIMAACTTTVMPGLEMFTRNEAATKAREGILEFLLINHPLDCPVCDRGGECDLQDFTLRYGPPTTRFVEAKRHFEKSVQVGANVILDRERCIMCQRCVRFCNEIAMDEGLVIVERGNRSFIGTFEDRSYDDPFSGNTIEICPVGALTAKSYRFRARPWEQQHFAGVCTNCSLGCNLTVDVRFDEVVRLRSRANDGIDDGWLCDRGRYGFSPVHSEDRLTQPLVRRGDTLEPSTWKVALARAAEMFEATEPTKVAAVAGSSLPNEAAWTLMKLMRSVVGSPHLDVADRHLQAAAPASARIEQCDKAQLIVLADCDPSESHPVLDLRIKKGLRNGARLLSAGEGHGLLKYTDYHFESEAAKSLTDLAKKLAKAKVKEEAIRMPGPRPWEAGGKTSHDMKQAVNDLAGVERILVVVDEDADQEVFEAASQLAGDAQNLLVLYHGANALGVREMGVVPHCGAGWQKPEDVEGFQAGDGYAKILEQKRSLLLVVEDNPFKEASKKADFVIALSTHANQTTEQADLVLPVCSWAEQTQTFTNTEGSLQISRQAIPPQGFSRPSLQVLCSLAEALGEPFEAVTPRQVFAEIGRMNPLYEGVSYRDFQTAGAHHWSYPQQGQLGTPRPDLSAIPVKTVDAPPWMPAVSTGSSVERAGRIRLGDRPPSVPGQQDPRRIARLLGLDETVLASDEHTKEGYQPLRVITGAEVQPPGPNPANRYHTFGVGTLALPPSAVAVADSPEVEAPEAEAEAPEAEADTPSPPPGGKTPEAKE